MRVLLTGAPPWDKRPRGTDTGIVAALGEVSTSPLHAVRKNSCPDNQADTTVADIVALSDIGAQDRASLLVSLLVVLHLLAVAEQFEIVVDRVFAPPPIES